MKISVIIPVYNEERVIGECLKSLGNQNYPDFEVIIVDDGSRDNSKLIAQNFKPYLKTQNLTILEQEHQGPGTARNLGADHARGEILVFVDADMAFAKDFLKKLAAPLLTGESNGTFSKEEFVSNWDNVWARCWNINAGWESKRRHPKRYPNKQKVFRAILKSEFAKVGGFDPKRGYNDDWSLSEKLGYQAKVAKGAIFYHQNPDNLVEVFKQAKWVAKRQYKLGLIGALYRLLVYSFPDSLWQGFWKSVFKREPFFFIFKIVFDFGAFLGILENIFLKKLTK